MPHGSPTSPFFESSLYLLVMQTDRQTVPQKTRSRNSITPLDAQKLGKEIPFSGVANNEYSIHSTRDSLTKSPQNHMQRHQRQDTDAELGNHPSQFIYHSGHHEDPPRISQAWLDYDMPSCFQACFQVSQLNLAFKDETLERFYQAYSSKQKVVYFVSILIFNICFAGVMIFLSSYEYSSNKIPILALISSSLMLSIIATAAYKKNYITGATLIALCYLLWVLIFLQIFVKILTSDFTMTTGDNTCWLLILNYFTYVVLPARRLYCFILSIGVNVIHLLVVIIYCYLNDQCVGDGDQSFLRQVSELAKMAADHHGKTMEVPTNG